MVEHVAIDIVVLERLDVAAEAKSVEPGSQVVEWR